MKKNPIPFLIGFVVRMRTARSPSWSRLLKTPSVPRGPNPDSKPIGVVVRKVKPCFAKEASAIDSGFTAKNQHRILSGLDLRPFNFLALQCYCQPPLPIAVDKSRRLGLVRPIGSEVTKIRSEP